MNDLEMAYFVHCHQSLQGFPLCFNRELKQICLIQVLRIFLVMVRSLDVGGGGGANDVLDDCLVDDDDSFNDVSINDDDSFDDVF